MKCKKKHLNMYAYNLKKCTLKRARAVYRFLPYRTIDKVNPIIMSLPFATQFIYSYKINVLNLKLNEFKKCFRFHNGRSKKNFIRPSFPDFSLNFRSKNECFIHYQWINGKSVDQTDNLLSKRKFISRSLRLDRNILHNLCKNETFNYLIE